MVNIAATGKINYLKIGDYSFFAKQQLIFTSRQKLITKMLT
jgi:hypothetical protein